MATTTTGSITLLETSQAQKTVTINEALEALTANISATLDVPVDNSNAVAITNVDPSFDFDRHVHFTLTDAGSPPTAQITVTIPASAKLFAVTNSTSFPAVVDGETVASGSSVLLYTDGLSTTLLSGGAGGGAGVDISQAGSSVVVGATEIDFVSGATIVNNGGVAEVSITSSGPSAVAAASEFTLHDDASITATLTDATSGIGAVLQAPVRNDSNMAWATPNSYTPNSSSTVTFRVRPAMLDGGFFGCGILIGDDTALQYSTWGFSSLTGAPAQGFQLTGIRFSGAAGASLVGASIGQLIKPDNYQDIWLRISDDGTDVTFAWSTDGEVFLTAAVQSRASIGLVSVDHIAAFIRPNRSGDYASPAIDTGAALIIRDVTVA